MDNQFTPSKKPRSNKAYYALVVAIWLGYATLTYFSPTRGVAHYNLSLSQTHLLQLSIVVPLLAIWLVAAYGALRFRRYANMIKSSPDGGAVDTLSNGLVVLVIYLLSSTLVGSIAPYFANTGYASTAVIIRNYLPLALALYSFGLLYQGSLKLTALIKAPTWRGSRVILFLIPYCIFAVFYTWVFYLNPNLHETASNGLPYFVLSRPWLLFTYVLPYLLTWFLGCLAALNIRLYARDVKGSIYRSALLNLVAGIGTVIFITLALQLLTTASSTINHLNLASLLLLVYLLVIFYAVGYALIAFGSKKLTRIEEVQ